MIIYGREIDKTVHKAFLIFKINLSDLSIITNHKLVTFTLCYFQIIKTVASRYFQIIKTVTFFFLPPLKFGGLVPMAKIFKVLGNMSTADTFPTSLKITQVQQWLVWTSKQTFLFFFFSFFSN